ncbi:MAG: glycosyltransferase [Colwellia sp.]|nr:glycosyltransferase [Colwellia sp.]
MNNIQSLPNGVSTSPKGLGIFDPEHNLDQRAMTKQINLNLVMIVKNEEKSLLRTLESVVGHVTHAYITDTGSTDSTLEVINSFTGFPISVNHTEFHDFSQARNEALVFAQRSITQSVSWLLLLDSNDILDSPSNGSEGCILQVIQKLPKTQDYIRVKQQWYSTFGNDASFWGYRLIKNTGSWLFSGVVHEHLIGTGRVEGQLPEHIQIVQDRELDNNQSYSRYLRDIRLLEKSNQDDPNNSRTIYYLAQSYFYTNNFQKAIEFDTMRVNNFNSQDEETFKSLVRIGDSMELVKEPWHKILPFYWRAWSLIQEAGILHKISNYYFKNGDFHTAYYIAQMECNTPKPEMQLVLNENIYVYERWILGSLISYKYSQTLIEKLKVKYDQEKQIWENQQDNSDQFPIFVLPENVKVILRNSLDYSNKALLSWKPIHTYNNYNKLKLIKSYCHETLLDYKLCSFPNASPFKLASPMIFIYGGEGYRPWNGSSMDSEYGLGGSESSCIQLAENLTELGYNVVVFSMCGGASSGSPGGTAATFVNGVLYQPLESYEEFITSYYVDTLIVLRYAEYLRYTDNITHTVLWLEDTVFIGKELVMNNKLSAVVTLTDWHREFFIEKYPQLEARTVVIGNALNAKNFVVQPDNKQTVTFMNAKSGTSDNVCPVKFIYSSCPTRGLDTVVELWPEICKVFPNIELHLYCDFDNSYVAAQTETDIPKLMNAINFFPNIKNHGRIPQVELRQIMLDSDIWFYPTDFNETYCVTALEMQASGVLCIHSNVAALQNTVGTRGCIIKPPNIETKAFDITTDELENKVFDMDELLGGHVVATEEQIKETYDARVVSIIDMMTKICDNQLVAENMIVEARDWALTQTWSTRVVEFVSLFKKETIYAQGDDQLYRIDYNKRLTESFHFGNGDNYYTPVINLLKQEITRTSINNLFSIESVEGVLPLVLQTCYNNVIIYCQNCVNCYGNINRNVKNPNLKLIRGNCDNIIKDNKPLQILIAQNKITETMTMLREIASTDPQLITKHYYMIEFQSPQQTKEISDFFVELKFAPFMVNENFAYFVHELRFVDFWTAYQSKITRLETSYKCGNIEANIINLVSVS